MKPVAIAIKSDNDFTEICWDDDEVNEIEEFYNLQGWNYELVPLYTAPRELSDEEIQNVYSEKHEIPANILAFARAILKKASEK